MLPLITGAQNLSSLISNMGKMNLGGPALTDTTSLTNQFPMAPDPNMVMGFHSPNLYGAPAMGGAGAGGFGGMLNGIGGLQGLSSIIGSIGSLYGAFQGAKLARDSLNFQREAYGKNLENQTKSYNTALSDRARSRGVMAGQTSDQVDDYINSNKLSV